MEPSSRMYDARVDLDYPEKRISYRLATPHTRRPRYCPKTYAERMQPKNVTEKVAQLASKGNLQALLLTNRYMPELPEELRRCTELICLSLEYTHRRYQLGSKSSRSWNSTPREQDESPDGRSPRQHVRRHILLTFIHLASFIPVTQLPSFHGLAHLRSATLAISLALKELPAFDRLEHLERLVISCVPTLHSLPNVTTVENLKSLVVLD
ncbi:uncharacterized protein IUM83_09188 [Phytophthora cinnamomi]|uniref:uncharacterized protein n=1 Tax=Phytophthora cinnamomi TaxID=4785 RepID=UPI003559F25E|nr:hypothetical protein IUM83_09188 [Phytophthora cinnamomi]